MSEKAKSVIRPGDIPVKTEKYRTVLSPVVSNLAASILSSPPEPLEMDVRPPCSLVDFKYFVSLDKRKIRSLRKNVWQMLKKYV